MRFGSVCSGIEAASVAWHPLGWQAAWLSEIEPFPSAVLKHHYPDVPNLGDMTQLPELILRGEVEAPDLFCGGTPCQAFSVAGLRKSLDDARGNLSLVFCEIANAIDHVRRARREPAAVVFWENVPGVLSTKDNAFGCFLAQLCGGDEPLVAPDGWPTAGCVSGPTRTAAWRVLDAQYFGVAQRRRRVFVVASARNDFDPAAVLFEWDGVRRDTAPSREAGQGAAAGTLRSTDGGSDLDHARAGHLPITMAHGQGGAEIGYDRGPCLTCNHEAPIAAIPDTAHTLRGEGFDASEDGTGRGTPLVPVHRDIAPTLTSNYGKQPDSSDTSAGPMLVPVTFRADAMREGTAKTPSADAEGRVRLRDPGMGMYEDIAPTLDCGAAHGVAQPVAFDWKMGEKARSIAVTENMAPTIGTQADRYAIAFHPTQDPIRSTDGSTHAMGTGSAGWCATAAVAIHENQRAEITLNDTAGTVKCAGGKPGQGYPAAMVGMQVRRLTPVECERLQGFPDSYTQIPWRNKTADQCPDGPRYKALGNSWAVPVVAWIGARIDAAVSASPRF